MAETIGPALSKKVLLERNARPLRTCCAFSEVSVFSHRADVGLRRVVPKTDVYEYMTKGIA
ncbi:hypothetical protein [Bradyrhizobium sp. th.b2]|uniref:hypothetical protein n=1 Tax=Bradyrhizobium sp. th-b2 TaxID=172088 RepID=UPI001FD95A76|nr:hypothetical protein [Bradyrhizobium sp. th.b2]